LAFPWTHRAARNGEFHIGVVEQVAAADDHGPLLAEHAITEGATIVREATKMLVV
jgi:hypothetical protein